MKTSLTALLALISFCSFSQERKTETVKTNYGTFGSTRADAGTQTNKTGRTATLSGANMEYHVAKTKDGGTSTIVKFTATLNEEVKEKAKTAKTGMLTFSVYPNPAHHEINVVIRDENPLQPNEQYTVRIKNLLGQTLFEEKLTERKLTIDASGFSKGFFLVEVASSGGRASPAQKVVVQ